MALARFMHTLDKCSGLTPYNSPGAPAAIDDGQLLTIPRGAYRFKLTSQNIEYIACFLLSLRIRLCGSNWAAVFVLAASYVVSVRSSSLCSPCRQGTFTGRLIYAAEFNQFLRLLGILIFQHW